MPTVEHFPVYRKDGGMETVDNVIPAHRLCSRLDHSLRVGRSHQRDLERIRKARKEGIRRNSVRIGNPEGGEIPTLEAEASDAEADEDQEGPGVEVPACRREGAVPPEPPDDLRSHLDEQAPARGREA